MTKELLPGLLAVEVPEGGCEIRMTETGLEYRASAGTWFVVIMCGYSILGIGASDKITDQEWSGVVYHGTGILNNEALYENYNQENDRIAYFLTATASGLSLLKLHNLNPLTTVLLTSKANT